MTYYYYFIRLDNFLMGFVTLGNLLILVPPLVGFFFGRFYDKYSKHLFFRKHLKPRQGHYTVYRKNSEEYSPMRELVLSWDPKEPSALTFKHIKGTTSGEGGPKIDRTSTGTVFFQDANYGSGFYKGDQSDYYGLAKFLLFPNNEIGYYRIYVRDDKSGASRIANNQEISTQFILKRKN